MTSAFWMVASRCATVIVVFPSIKRARPSRTSFSEAASRRSEYATPVYVRTNSPQSDLIEQDLKAAKGFDGIVLPKVSSAAEVRHIGAQVDSKMHIMPSIEDAKGVVSAYQIASADIRVNALVFGVFDFLHDMLLDYDENDDSGYAYARTKVPVDARAAGIAAIDGIWQKVDDIDGLVRDATIAKRLGYSGKSIIHPGQIDPVHNVFRPTKVEVEWAKKVVEALSGVMEKGNRRECKCGATPSTIRICHHTNICICEDGRCISILAACR